MTRPIRPAETRQPTAAFLLERVRAARGPLWDEGRARVVPPPPLSSGPALRVFAERRVRGVPEDVVRGLFAWEQGGRPVDLLFEVPPAEGVLERQARGRRCVCLLDDAVARAHGDPRHPDGLTFVLHDLCHLEKFVAPEHHAGQVGFFRAVARALAAPAMAALERELDDAWRAERDYVISDMNGSAVFLFAALKMKVNMAVRRRLWRGRGGPAPAPTSGPLDADERAAVEPALTVLFDGMDLPAELRDGARLVSTRRDRPAEAAARELERLAQHFEARASAMDAPINGCADAAVADVLEVGVSREDRQIMRERDGRDEEIQRLHAHATTTQEIAEVAGLFHNCGCSTVWHPCKRRSTCARPVRRGPREALYSRGHRHRLIVLDGLVDDLGDGVPIPEEVDPRRRVHEDHRRVRSRFSSRRTSPRSCRSEDRRERLSSAANASIKVGVMPLPVSRCALASISSGRLTVTFLSLPIRSV